MLLLFYVLLARRHPRATLFPYTTLFRSVVRGNLASDFANVFLDLMHDICVLRLRRRFRDLGNFAADRKSTRLNSSHSQISYAVFCLKKKRTRTVVPGLSLQAATPAAVDA